MGYLLRFLFIAILALYLIRFLRTLFISFMGGMAGNAQQSRGGQQYYQQKQNRPFDNKVRIDHIPQQKKNQVPDTEGDFVDYEEIK
jgi:hypothetical protein